jgi:hypothetical protein
MIPKIPGFRDSGIRGIPATFNIPGFRGFNIPGIAGTLGCAEDGRSSRWGQSLESLGRE